MIIYLVPPHSYLEIGGNKHIPATENGTNDLNYYIHIFEKQTKSTKGKNYIDTLHIAFNGKEKEWQPRESDVLMSNGIVHETILKKI